MSNLPCVIDSFGSKIDNISFSRPFLSRDAAQLSLVSKFEAKFDVAVISCLPSFLDSFDSFCFFSFFYLYYSKKIFFSSKYFCFFQNEPSFVFRLHPSLPTTHLYLLFFWFFFANKILPYRNLPTHVPPSS